MEKINFSGGEPFIEGPQGKFVGDLVRYCKQELGLSVSIVTNGSLIKEQWFKNYAEYLDILAISCDSFDEDVNIKIGRRHPKESHINIIRRVRDWCTKYHVAFKINTVVNSYNKNEDMSEAITELNPIRWKVFQCLLIGGENMGEDALKNAEDFVISDEEFQSFISRHNTMKCLVPESNEKMRNSYLILDEYMRFLDNTGGSKVPSKSILDVGVQNALNSSGFDEQMFYERGGKYVWSKGDMTLDW